MGLSLTQYDRDAHQIEARERIERLRTFSPGQLAAGLIWLSGHDPGTFDAALDAAQPCPGNEKLSESEPEPARGSCGEKIGIFLRLSLDWRQYKETRDTGPADGQDRLDGTGTGQIELFDPGQAPMLAWRPPGQATTRR